MNEPITLSMSVVIAIIGCVGVVAGSIIALVGSVLVRQQQEMGRLGGRVEFLEAQREKAESRFMKRIEQLTHWGIWAVGDPPREPPIWVKDEVES